jgi:putative heme-binding domain-containing protein
MYLGTQLLLPGKQAVLSITANHEFYADATGKENYVFGEKKEGHFVATLNADLTSGSSALGMFIKTGGDAGAPSVQVTYHTNEHPTERPIPCEALLPDKAPLKTQEVISKPTQSQLTKGGDWNAGKALFFGEAKCAACHTLRGEGGAIGPNLSNLNQVNPESVLQDIIEPSARINPDHISYIITTTSGDTVSGLIRQEGDQLIVLEGIDKQTKVPRADVKEIRPSKISLMPEGYKELGEKKLRDLLLFLTEEAPPKAGGK